MGGDKQLEVLHHTKRPDDGGGRLRLSAGSKNFGVAVGHIPAPHGRACLQDCAGQRERALQSQSERKAHSLAFGVCCACFIHSLQKLPLSLDDCRVDICSTLRTCVLGPLISYLPTISPLLQDCPATRSMWMHLQEDVPHMWRDASWQKVCRQGWVMHGAMRGKNYSLS